MSDNLNGLEGCGDMLPSETSAVRSSVEQLYPGSHELRPVALFRVESPLAPEGMLVLASFEKAPLREVPLNEWPSPEQTLELLSAAAAALAGQVQSTKEVLAKLGHGNRSTQYPSAPCRSES